MDDKSRKPAPRELRIDAGGAGLKGLQKALSADARRAWDALVAASGRVDHDEFVNDHDKAMAELRLAGLVVVAAVDGAPSVAIPAVVRRTLGIAEKRPDKDEGAWSIGVVQMPQVRIAGVEKTPIIAIVTGGDGRVLAQAVGDPDARRELVATAFTKSCADGRPTRITAADDDIARSLARAGAAPDMIVVGHSADIDQVSSQLRYAIAGSQSYLQTGASASTVRGLFDAAADLYMSAPWGVVPDDGCLFCICAPGHYEVVACVIGQLGEEHGYVLFDSVAACARWRECLQSTAGGAEVTFGAPAPVRPVAPSAPPARRATPTATVRQHSDIDVPLPRARSMSV